ncbi:3-deoxy-manno-octulosonate cytidylyltransferase [Pseudoalteromonas peptidolytica]|nr:3-deoxy-manno-octulosonate cytidylyltransferase [Pseudoalteromonas peptidolytica]
MISESLKMKERSLKVVIPARYGSSRLPAKPLLEINGKPVFWHVVQRVLEAGVSINDIILATDDVKIEEKAKSLSIPVIMTASGHISGTDRVHEVAIKLGWPDSTLVMNVQGDEPLIPDMLICRLVEFATRNQHFSILTAATKITRLSELHNCNVVKAIITEYNEALYFTRAPAPIDRDDPNDISAAKRHIGIYVYKVSALKTICGLPESRLEKLEKLEQLRALSNGLSIGVMDYDGEIPHGIDTMEDYLVVKQKMEGL